MRVFNEQELKNLYKPATNSSGEDNGQVTIIGGSELFHGAPIFALKVASRMNDMVFFASPEPSVGKVAENIKSKLMSFIWVPWEDTEAYVEKSDAVLIGPGFMRFDSEKQSEEERGKGEHKNGKRSKAITKKFLEKFPDKKWVIDAGSLQVMEKEWIPKGAIITPNRKEFGILFGYMDPEAAAKRYNCIIVLKGPETQVVSPNEKIIITGGNPGLTKGGTGDVLAGITISLLAKNDPFLSACAASFIEKKAADEIFEKVGTNYNADDLADTIPEVFQRLVNKRK